MRILEFSGEELEHVAREVFIPVIVRTDPGFRGRVAFQELGQTLTLTRSHPGQMSAVRTDRMASRASADNLMVLWIQTAGWGRARQHDRLVELAGGSGSACEGP